VHNGKVHEIHLHLLTRWILWTIIR
jgi:hypothetical protein